MLAMRAPWGSMNASYIINEITNNVAAVPGLRGNYWRAARRSSSGAARHRHARARGQLYSKGSSAYFIDEVHAELRRVCQVRDRLLPSCYRVAASFSATYSRELPVEALVLAHQC